MRVFSFKEFNKKPKKKKFNIKLLLRVVLSLTLVLFMVFMPNILLNRNLYIVQTDKYFKKIEEPKLLTLWHIETFEGGVSSRQSFLEKLAVEFGKNNNTFITIKTLTPKQAVLNFSEGGCDIVSFGFGLGSVVKDFLIELEQVFLREEFLNSGKIKEQIFAYPYMFGGYATITRESVVVANGIEKEKVFENLSNITTKNKKDKNYSIGFSKKAFTKFSNALVENDVKEKKELFFENVLTPYETYNQFLHGSFATLLGTTRDVVRCKNREEKGNLEPCVYNYLGNYTDLVQYLGITTKDQTKQIVAKEFLNFVLSNSVQKQITKVGMFSVVDDEIYKDGYLRDFEKVFKNKFKVPNVFEEVV